MKVLLPVDGSPCSRAAVRSVTQRPWPEATQLKVLTVVHARIPAFFDPFLVGYAAHSDALEAARSDAPRLVESVAAEVRDSSPGLSVMTGVREGEPKNLIVAEAREWGADLIVMGSHGYGPVRRFFLGSVAMGVLLHAPCSVEIVRSVPAAAETTKSPPVEPAETAVSEPAAAAGSAGAAPPSVKVRAVMSPEVKTVGKEASAEEAASLMSTFDVGALPVCDGERVIGLVTDRDLALRVVSHGLDPRAVRVGEIATTPALSCREDDDLTAAAQRMEEDQVRRLVVLDGEGHLMGMLSLDDVAKIEGGSRLAGEVLAHVLHPRPTLRSEEAEVTHPLHLPQGLWRHLQALADGLGISESELVRRFVEPGLHDYEERVMSRSGEFAITR